MTEKQAKLTDTLTITIPHRWRINNNVLVIAGEPQQYYELRFLSMSMLYDEILVQWIDRYDLTATKLIMAFQHCGWVDTKREKKKELLKDKKNVHGKGTYEIEVNVCLMEKTG